MATKRFKRLNSSEDSVKRCYPDASFGLYHESACRSLFGSEVEGGRRWVFFFCFFFQVVFFRLHRLRASILVRPAGLDRPSSSVSAPSLTLLLSNVCVWVTYLNLLSNSLSSENLCMHVGVFLSF